MYERLMGVPSPTLSYISPCLDLYRSHLSSPTIFLYVSEEPEWGRGRLVRDRDVVVVEDGRGLGEDLALLALTNHTILTRWVRQEPRWC